MIFEVRSQGLQSDVITYSAAISAPEKSTQRQRLVELIVEMRSQGLRADVIARSAAISACVKSTQLQRFPELIVWFARRDCPQT